MEKHHNIKAGIFWILLSTLCFAFMSTCAKVVERDVSVSTVMLFRFGFSFLAFLPWFLIKFKKTIYTEHFWLIIARSIGATIAIYFFFFCIRYVPMVDSILLTSASPLYVPIILKIALKTKTSIAVYWGILMGFVGLILILRPGTEIFGFPSLFGLFSGIIAGIGLILLRIIGQKAEPKQIFFYYFFIAAVASGIGAIFTWQPIDPSKLGYLLAIGAFGLLYQVGLTMALRAAEVQLMSSLLFLSVVFGGALDWIFFHNIPSFLSFIGMVLVIGGSLITIIYGRKRIVIPHKEEETR